jgi:hypothetical protein
MTVRNLILEELAINPFRTAAELAALFNVSRQRVNQILRSEQVATRRERLPVPRPEYQCWWNMLDRCANPQNPTFKYYGGRGISVCMRWRDFRNFFADMGPKPSSGHSIDRVNNDGNYEPSNCRWADRSTQQKNKRYPPKSPKPLPQRGRGRPKWELTTAERDVAELEWRSRRHQNDEQRTLAVQRRLGKQVSRAWLRLTLGSPHGR